MSKQPGWCRLEGKKTKAMVRAHNAITELTRSGRMQKAKNLLCSDCGSQAAEYDHFKGYSETDRFSVQPVCRSCHTKRGSVKASIRKIGPRLKGGRFFSTYQSGKNVGKSVGIKLWDLTSRKRER